MSSFNLRSDEYIVDEVSKLQFNEKHFDEAASRYDLATIGLSLGQDSSWKRELVDLLSEENPKIVVDLASGTGDVTRAVADRFPQAQVYGVDLSKEMIDKATKLNRSANVQFLKRDMTKLPFPESSVELITGSYALRNAPNLRTVIAEISRILSNRGVAVFIDFVKSEQPRKAALQRLVMRYWGGFWGLVLHGNREVHGYIARSLLDFPTLKELDQLFANEKLQLEKRKLFMGGMVSLSFYRKNS